MAAVLPKRKRISKKNKAAWRKTDVQDVEEFLEEQRQEERIGTFADKKDEDLFILDTALADNKIKSAITRSQRRKLNAQKPFRSHEALINPSKVQDPIAKRNHVKSKKSGRVLEEEICNPTKARHFQANADRQRYYEQLDKKLNRKTEINTAKDIWAEEDFRDKIPGLKDEKGWISRELSLYVSKNIGKPVIKVHDSIRHRTTKAKNFEVPHSGTSYNPSFKDHQALLSQVVEKEQKIIKEEKHLKRVTTEMFSKVTPEQRDERKLKEMLAGLDEAADEIKTEATDDENADSHYISVNAPVENKKKSRQVRNRELKQKELLAKQLEKKALKKQVADLNRIKSIKNEVLAEEAQLNALKKHRKKVEFKKKFETKRLGRLKFVEPDMDVNMMEDISGNLRNLKTESSLLIDRFKNFQKRNMLPTSVHTGKQKAPKIKRFTRNTHKEPGVSFDMLRQNRRVQKAQLQKV